MFGRIGVPELLLILVVVLLIFGPKRLPEIGKSIGRGLREFRSASKDFQRSLDDDDEEDEEVEKKEKKEKKEEQEKQETSDNKQEE